MCLLRNATTKIIFSTHRKPVIPRVREISIVVHPSLSVVRKRQVRESNLGPFQIDQHAYTATANQTIFGSAHLFSVDDKGQFIITAHNVERVGLMSQVELFLEDSKRN